MVNTRHIMFFWIINIFLKIFLFAYLRLNLARLFFSFITNLRQLSFTLVVFCFSKAKCELHQFPVDTVWYKNIFECLRSRYCFLFCFFILIELFLVCQKNCIMAATLSEDCLLCNNCWMLRTLCAKLTQGDRSIMMSTQRWEGFLKKHFTGSGELGEV